MTIKQLARTERARKNLALKLILERRFIPEIRKYFNKIAREFRIFYSTTGRLPRRNTFTDDTTALLRKHYIRVGKAFKDEMRLAGAPEKQAQIKQDEAIPGGSPPEKTEQEKSDITDAAILLFINNEVPARAEFINETNVRDMNDSVSQAMTQLTENGEQITNSAVATLGASILLLKFASRTNTIAMTETQFMAESTKAIEAAVELNLGDIDLDVVVSTPGGALAQTKTGTKTWASILDNRVREAHVSADGQTVKASEPFIVMGEKLMYPRDTSLGATAGNTINCRCSSLYSF
jgi:uncharacterized protein with gpF-like domain